MRESAIFGILGVAILGYLVDAAITAPRLGAAMVLIVSTGLLPLGINVLSRTLRLRIGNRHLRLSAGTAPRRSAPACA